jgi:DNA-binding SARP family transcriptional activator/pimeloyl-ACP methyl ester carboxylesterase
MQGRELRLNVLGGLDIRWESGKPIGLPTRKGEALLVYLALAAGRPQPRGKVAALLWNRSAEEQARASLRQTLFTLRHALSGARTETLGSSSESVWLEAGCVEVDALSFERAAEETAPEGWARAAALYRGDFLEGFSVRSQPFEEWLMVQRTRLREHALEVMARLLAQQVESGAHEEATRIAQRILALDPLRETVHRALMRLHAERGHANAALKQYQACAQALRRELGVDPDSETQALYHQILARRPAGGAQESPQPASPEGSEPALEQIIRFCTATDGARIAYATVGRGPALVKAANWLNHLEYDWESPVWRHLLTALARDHLLVRYDERGNGLSDWDVDDISFDAFVRDLETVVDTLGLERFALLGISQGCAVSIAYAVRHPERVTHLVLHGGYARGWERQGSPGEIERHEALLTLARSGWGQENPAFREVFTTQIIPDATPEQKQSFNDMERISASPENAVRLQRVFGEIDVSGLLGQVAAPTLVLHSRNDARIPFAWGRELASAVPGAHFVPLESRNHLILEHEPAWERWLSEVERFLAGGAGAGPG